MIRQNTLDMNLQTATPTGIEVDALAPISAPDAKISFPTGRTRLIQVVLRDQSDARAELVEENEWLLMTCEAETLLQGNVFVLEDIVEESGTIFVKLAPLPHARAIKSEWDVRFNGNGHFERNQSDGYQWRAVAYEGGKWGRIAAMHAMQREIRPYNAAQDGLLLTNTWGDRGRDAHLNTAFMEREIEGAARLGADVMQIDAGWHSGVDANSVKSQGDGIWDGFWDSDPNFWEVDVVRFPEGLNGLFDKARAKNLRVGLWFAPDSLGEAANWERDADLILRHHRELGVNFFKIDALKITTPQSEANFRKLFAKVNAESHGAVTFDLDITAEHRFGYFGLIEPGPLFVENRYTDFHRYWPHHTLRVAWQLAHWIDPVRLRLEWLNNARNLEKYADDPLSPALYRPDTLFATVMMCAPLGWFEIQNLPESYFEEAAPLIAKWKIERAAMCSGTILPVGAAPDGVAWTGFVSLGADRKSGYALLFRELNSSADYELRVPMLESLSAHVEILGGQGSATLEAGVLKVNIPEKLRFLWVRI